MKENRAIALMLAAVAAVAGFAAEGQVPCGVEAVTCATCRCNAEKRGIDVDFLVKMGCDYFQGYYFARPVSLDEYEKKNLSVS